MAGTLQWTAVDIVRTIEKAADKLGRILGDAQRTFFLQYTRQDTRSVEKRDTIMRNVLFY